MKLSLSDPPQVNLIRISSHALTNRHLLMAITMAKRFTGRFKMKTIQSKHPSTCSISIQFRIVQSKIRRAPHYLGANCSETKFKEWSLALEDFR